MEENAETARALCRAAMGAGVAPYAPHVFFPAIGLNDEVPADRSAGMKCGLSWLAMADELWVFALGYDECSEGMKREVEAAMKCSVPLDVAYMPKAFEPLWEARERVRRSRQEPPCRADGLVSELS